MAILCVSINADTLCLSFPVFSVDQLVLAEVTLAIPVPVGIKARFVACNIEGKHIKVGLTGEPRSWIQLILQHFPTHAHSIMWI